MNIKVTRLFDKYILALLIPFISLLSYVFKKKKVLESPKKILIIKLWAIGDSLLTLPMLKALKTKYPNCQIDVLCHTRNKDVYTGQPFIDEIHLFSPKHVWHLWKKYDIAIDTEPYLNVSALIAWWTSFFSIGFAKQWRSFTYNSKTPFRKDQHMVANYMDMLKVFGFAVQVKKLVKVPVPDEAKQRIKEIVIEHKIKKRNILVGISPGVAESVKSRMWPLDKMAALADRLLDELHVKIVFLEGPSNKETVDEIIAKMASLKKDSHIINLAGQTSLKETFFLMTGLPIYLSNDTGPMHMAAAQGCKTIGLFGPNIPELWAPYGPGNTAIYNPVHCSPCIVNDKGVMPECKYKGTDQYQICMRRITINEVFDAVKEKVSEVRGER